MPGGRPRSQPRATCELPDGRSLHLVDYYPESRIMLIGPDGATLDFPLDTSTPVAWVGFANAVLEAHVRPALDAALRASFGA